MKNARSNSRESNFQTLPQASNALQHSMHSRLSASLTRNIKQPKNEKSSNACLFNRCFVQDSAARLTLSSTPKWVVLVTKSERVLLGAVVVVLLSTVCKSFRLLEKWFPLQGERAHSLYFWS